MTRSLARHSPRLTDRRRYFPSVRDVLLLRFDPGTTDSYDPDLIRDESEPDPDLPARRKNKTRKLAGITRGTGPKVFSSEDFRAALTSANVNLADAVAKLPRTDELTRVFDLQPTRSNRRINSYRKADELDLTFEWKSMPFDSRLIRAVLCFHYEGTVPADAWATGARELSPASPSPSGYLVPATSDNLRWVGTIDEVSDSHGDGGDVLTMKGRDLTSILIDTKYPAQLSPARIPSGSTILQIIQAILETNDLFELIRGPFLRTQNGTLPQLDPARFPRRLVPAKERHRGGAFALRYPPKSAGKSSYWDVITDLCVSHGLRPAIEKDMLVLSEPRILYAVRQPDQVASPGTPTFPTPYRLGIGDRFPIRRMVYGDNVGALRFHRKLGRIKAPAVEVVAMDPDAARADQRLIKVRHPPKTKSGRRANNVDPTGEKPSETVHRVPIKGVVDRTQLLNIAKQIYEGMGRQELGVVIETDDPASYSDVPAFDPNEDPDLLAVRSGDPVRLLVTTPQASRTRLFTFSELQARLSRSQATGGTGFNSAVAFLVEQGFTRPDAIQFARVLASASLPQEFRLITASVSFDGEGAGGFNIQMDCRDYVRARADPEGVSQTRGTKVSPTGSARDTEEPLPNAPPGGQNSR